MQNVLELIKKSSQPKKKGALSLMAEASKPKTLLPEALNRDKINGVLEKLRAINAKPEEVEKVKAQLMREEGLSEIEFQDIKVKL